MKKLFHPTFAVTLLGLSAVAWADSTAEKSKDLADTLARVEKLKTDVAPVSEALERERDRNGKLRKALLGEQASGCFARQSIQKLQVVINGTHLENAAYDPNTVSAAAVSDPNATQITFSFSNNFKYIHTDEKKENLFRAQGQFVSTAYNMKTIGDIESIAVTKGGVAYYTEQKCQTGLFGGKKNCEFRNQETEMYRLDSIAIYANDELVYKNDAVSFAFHKGALTWTDTALTSSPEYLKLMSRTDCPLTQ